MTAQNGIMKKAVTQMVELSRELLQKQLSRYSDLGQCSDDQKRRELEDLYYNEIKATANVIRLFTGREFSLQWTRGADGEFKHGFAIYEIMNDVPCSAIPCGVSHTTYSRYSGEQEEDRRIDWGKGRDEGKIVKVYELIFDPAANPCYVGGYQSKEFQAT